MTDETKLQEQQYRGDEAKRLLEHPLIKEFFAMAEQAAVNTWKESDYHDVEGQRAAKAVLRATEALRQQFEVCIRNGQIAERELMQTRDPKKPLRS